jgi:hypothetical protein
MFPKRFGKSVKGDVGGHKCNPFRIGEVNMLLAPLRFGKFWPGKANGVGNV